MRILHISKYYHPFRGGIEKVIKELAEATVLQGHEVTVLCANESNKRSEEIINGVRVIRLPSWATLFSQPVTPSVFWEVQHLVSQADTVQLHTPNPLFEFAYLFCRPEVPFIVTYHCEVMKNRSLVKFYEPVSKAVLERADSIIIATDNHLKYSRWLRKYAHKCQIIPFGIQAKHANRNIEIVKKLKSIKDKYSRYFLFIGRMVAYKGVNVLLESMQNVEQNLVLIGKGPLFEQWQKLSKNLGVSDRVHFLGQVNDEEEFSAYLHGCDAVVLPSLNEAEAFGLVLLEAMACGKPIITTELNSGVRMVNSPGETGLEVPPSNVLRLTEAMNHMASNHEMRLQMGINAKVRFENMFRIDKFVQSYLGVYAQMIGETTVPPLKEWEPIKYEPNVS